MDELWNREVRKMESKKWLWVVILCLVIVAAYQIVKLSSRGPAESPSPEAEQALEPQSMPMQTASLGELTGMLEKSELQVLQPPETAEPPQASTETPEDSEAEQKDAEQDMPEPAEGPEVVQVPQTPPTVVDQPAEEKSLAASTTTGPLESSNRGLVRAIVYSRQRASTLIDDKIMHAGDTVDGVKIVRIHADGVDLEKSGQAWTQKVSETPNPLWQ
jgi:hypothetical protein